MTNEVKPETTIRAALTDGELSALLNMAGIRPDRASPLAGISSAAASTDAAKIQQAGLTDASGKITAACRECLNILANPATEIDMLWGNSDGASVSKVFAAAGGSKLVSFTRLNGVNNMSFFLASESLTDLIIEKLVFNEIKQFPDLKLETVPAALPVFFSLLDLYREAQLKTALERRQETAVTVTPEEINRVLQESKLEPNMSWYAPVGYLALPDGAAVTEASVAEGVSALKREGIIGSDGTLSGRVAAFAYRAFPLFSFFGIKALARDGASIEKTEIALFRGIASLLFVQLFSEGAGDRVVMKSISTSNLPEILFNLVTRPFKAAPPAAESPAAQPAAGTTVCASCGTQNPAQAKFCAKCGAVMTAAPKAKFCPKCGDPVKPGEKFCDKCGAKLG